MSGNWSGNVKILIDRTKIFKKNLYLEDFDRYRIILKIEDIKVMKAFIAKCFVLSFHSFRSTSY